VCCTTPASEPCRPPTRRSLCECAAGWGATNATAVHQNQKGGAAQIGVKNKDTKDSNQAEPQRPVNPFAKSSSSKEESLSLLNSIKMKVKNEKVDKAITKKVKV
jgi:chromosome transmission fidelity protein 4